MTEGIPFSPGADSRRWSKISKAIILTSFATLLLPFGFAAQAQQARKVPMIGVLFPGFPATYSARSKAFSQALYELGLR
jgi:hypothetical protein